MEQLKRYIKKAKLIIPRLIGSINIHKKSDYHYVPDYYGRSSRKQSDIRTLPGFGTLAATVIQHGKTYLYYDRLFTIYQALNNYKRNSGKLNFAEVGVFQGGTSYFMASAAKDLGLGDATIYCFDTFEGHSALDVRLDKDPYHRPKHFDGTSYADVKKYLEGFENVNVIKGRFQDTCTLVENEKFHFVHLDVDIYEPTIFTLSFFDKYLEIGGAVVIDDYGFQSCPGARAAVDEFVNTNPNYFSFELLTGQCILIRKS